MIMVSTMAWVSDVQQNIYKCKLLYIMITKHTDFNIHWTEIIKRKTMKRTHMDKLSERKVTENQTRTDQNRPEQYNCHISRLVYFDFKLSLSTKHFKQNKLIQKSSVSQRHFVMLMVLVLFLNVLVYRPNTIFGFFLFHAFPTAKIKTLSQCLATNK